MTSIPLLAIFKYGKHFCLLYSFPSWPLYDEVTKLRGRDSRMISVPNLFGKSWRPVPLTSHTYSYKYEFMFPHWIILGQLVYKTGFQISIISYTPCLLLKRIFQLLDYLHNHLDSQNNFQDQVLRRQRRFPNQSDVHELSCPSMLNLTAGRFVLHIQPHLWIN